MIARTMAKVRKNATDEEEQPLPAGIGKVLAVEGARGSGAAGSERLRPSRPWGCRELGTEFVRVNAEASPVSKSLGERRSPLRQHPNGTPRDAEGDQGVGHAEQHAFAHRLRVSDAEQDQIHDYV